MKRILLVGSLLMSLVFFGSCGGGSSSSSSGCTITGDSSPSCASGSNDFYVVENGAGASCAGKLSRVNPDAGCKEVIAAGFTAPIDIVFATSTIGFMSTCPAGGDATLALTKPGQIWKVDLSQSGTNRVSLFQDEEAWLCPEGLAYNASADNTSFGCLTTNTDGVLLIADTGSTQGGTVWSLCLNNGAFSAAMTTTQSAGIQNPRGVVFENTTTFIANGKNPADNSQGRLSEFNLGSGGSSTILTDALNPTMKDISIDPLNNSLLIADINTGSTAGQIVRCVLGVGCMTVQSDLSGPRDVLPRGTQDYLITQFDGGDVVMAALAGGNTSTSVTSGITLSYPDGIAKP